eukprot:gene7003-7787_t
MSVSLTTKRSQTLLMTVQLMKQGKQQSIRVFLNMIQNGHFQAPITTFLGLGRIATKTIHVAVTSIFVLIHACALAISAIIAAQLTIILAQMLMNVFKPTRVTMVEFAKTPLVPSYASAQLEQLDLVVR